MSGESYYQLTLISILISPFIFVIVKKRILAFINLVLVVLFFASWFWAIHYKTTPDKLYLGEVSFTVMVILVTSIVWVSFSYLLNGIIQLRLPKFLMLVIFFAASVIIYNIFYYEFPTNFDIFYARFHIIFLFLLLITSLIGFLFIKIKTRFNQ
jgi:hypothetical protein